MTPQRRRSDHSWTHRVSQGARMILPPFAYVLLVAAAFFGAVALEHKDRDRLNDAELASCARVKIVRAEGNTIAAVAFLAFLESANREHRLGLTASGSQRLVHLRSSRSLLITSRAMRWTPQTDCRAAVEHARRYRAPLPRAFTPRVARRILREAVSAEP